MNRAMLLALMNIIFYIIIPSILFQYLSNLVPAGTVPFTPTFIYAFGGFITGLQVLGALTEGMMISIPFESGGFIATAVYIYLAVEGGVIEVAARGHTFVFSFQPLLYLLVLPPMYGALKAPVSYLLGHSEAARASPDSV